MLLILGIANWGEILSSGAKKKPARPKVLGWKKRNISVAPKEIATTQNQWQRLQDLFEAAVDLPASRRAGYLEEACRGDDGLRRQAESLLVAADTGDRVAAAVDAAVNVFTGPQIAVGSHLGPYRVLREIGRGGMGAVCLAVRDDDHYSKQVAVKLIRVGMETPEATARFRAERQILADLDHPNIARLLDGGATERGLPFVVMEYVDGLPLTEYCDREGLGLRQRIALFRKACAAVEYAHRHLVVHRDLKPGNILVGADGEPKLLDFGIAKLLSEDVPGAFHTRTNARLMTLEYASPEQVKGLPVSTASDVYAMGVILFELLSGQRPYEATSDRPFELERAICEAPPRRPSTAAAGTIAKDHEGAVIPRRALAGDLDNIVLKALSKEPSRRYASVEQLSEDLRRYLDGYPVMARPVAWSYRAAKFVRRNRVATGAVALVMILILGFAVSMAALAGRLARERDRAQRVSSFLADVFRVSDPSESRGNTLTAREVLDRGARRIDQDLGIEPVVRATLKLTIARVYQSIGLHSEALPLLRQALATRERLTDPHSMETAEAVQSLGWSVEMHGDNAAAEQLYRRALELRRAKLGPLHPDTLESMSSLAGLLRVRGRYSESERLYREILAARRKPGEPASTLAADTMHGLAQTLHDEGKYSEAEPLFREALAIRRARLGNDHPEIPDNLNNLALLLFSEGRYAEAEPLYRESLDLYRKILGPEHPDVAVSLSNLALLLTSEGRGGEAEPLYREALALRRKVLGPDHQLLANTMKNLADLLKDEGDPAEAESLYGQALEILRKRVGEQHQYVAGVLRGQALLHVATGRLALAEEEARQALALRRKLFGQQDHRVADGLAVLARVLAARGDPSAEQLFRESLRMYQATEAKNYPGIAAPLLGLGNVLLRRRAPAEAEPLLREALAIRRKKRPAGHWSVVEVENSLAECLAQLGHRDESRALLKPLQAGFAVRGLAAREAARTRAVIVASLSGAAKLAKAKEE